MRNARRWSLVGVVVAAGYVGGGCDSAASVGAPVETAREVLASPTQMAVVPASSGVALRAELDRGDHVDAGRVAIAVTRGSLWTRTAGNQLVIDSLALELAPVDLPADVLEGARLTDLRLRLPAAVYTRDARWHDDDNGCDATATAALELDWSLELDGKSYPLAPQRIDGIDLAMMIGRDGDAVTLDVGAMGSGTRWSWADLVWFDDLTVTIGATTR